MRFYCRIMTFAFKQTCLKLPYSTLLVSRAPIRLLWTHSYWVKNIIRSRFMKICVFLSLEIGPKRGHLSCPIQYLLSFATLSFLYMNSTIDIYIYKQRYDNIDVICRIPFEPFLRGHSTETYFSLSSTERYEEESWFTRGLNVRKS